MLVFLDFEASSLAKQSYPIEVAWVFDDGRSEAHLIRPAPDWTDWDTEAQAIHHIERSTLEAKGTPHDVVARRMIEVLTGHDLLASAPSWDGKWLSVLLRAAGEPRHALRLRDSDEAFAACARDMLVSVANAATLDQEVLEVMALAEVRDKESPAHRALPDAEQERARWLAVCAAAEGRAKALARNEAAET